MTTSSAPSRLLPVYIAIVAAIGATSAGLVTAATVTSPGLVSWAVIAAAFAATEIGVVHIRLGRNAFSFILHEAVLVAAALVATPRDTMIGLVVGTVFVMAGVQRLSPAKVVFNLGQYLISAAVVVGVLSPLGVASIHTMWGWGLTFATTSSVGLATMFLVAFVIRLAQGMPMMATVRRSVTSSAVVTAVSSAIGLAVASVAVVGPAKLVLLLPVVGFIALGVRSYHQLLRRSHQLELVHDTVRSMSTAVELERALEVLVAQACETLTAERAVIVLRDRSGGTRQVSVEPGGTTWGVPSTVFVDTLEAAIRAGRGVATVESSSNLFAEVFTSTHVTGPAQALLAELAVGDRSLGIIAVVQGRGAENAGAQELELLRSLALHAALVLEANRLADAHAQLRERTATDPLLGLPTAQTIDDAIESAQAPTALVYVSLTEFESVNDLYGFEIGDEILAAVAGRLRNLARPDDIVARLGGDEFGIFIAGASDPFAIEAFGERIVQQLATPFRVDGTQEAITVGARVGIGFSAGGGDDAAAMIRSAHQHLRRRRLRRHLGVDGF